MMPLTLQAGALIPRYSMKIWPSRKFIPIHIPPHLTSLLLCLLHLSSPGPFIASIHLSLLYSPSLASAERRSLGSHIDASLLPSKKSPHCCCCCCPPNLCWREQRWQTERNRLQPLPPCVVFVAPLHRAFIESSQQGESSQGGRKLPMLFFC